MFTLRPNSFWTSQGLMRPRTAPDRNMLSKLFFTLSPRQKAQMFKTSRRAADTLGQRAPQAAPVNNPAAARGRQAAQNQHVVYEYNPDWVSPEETRQMAELDEGADRLMTEMTQADRDLAALSAQTSHGYVRADVSLTAQQTFDRIDDQMKRWSLRADEVELATSNPNWMVVNPNTGVRTPAAALPGLRRMPGNGTPLPQRSQMAPQRFMPGQPKQGEPRQPRVDVSGRVLSPSAQVRQQRLRMTEKIAQKGAAKQPDNLRQKMNQLSKGPQMQRPSLRRMAMARLANLQGTIDSMAMELQEHRRKIENNLAQRGDRRRSRAPSDGPLAVPTFKPKMKGETV